MSKLTQPQQLQQELEKVIERFRLEYDLTICDAIGTLEIVKLNLWDEFSEPEDDEED